MRIIVASLFVIFLVSVNVAEAQRFLPFTKMPVSQEEYARAVETNNLGVLNVADVKEFVDAVNKQHPELEISSPAELATYIRSLAVRPCPQVVASVAGIERTSRVIDLAGISRPLRAGEMCLYDNNLAIWFVSLSCGNLITSPISVFTAMVLDSEDGGGQSVLETGSRLARELEGGENNSSTSTRGGGGFRSFVGRHKGAILKGAAVVGVTAIVVSLLKPMQHQEVNINSTVRR